MTESWRNRSQRIRFHWGSVRPLLAAVALFLGSGVWPPAASAAGAESVTFTGDGLESPVEISLYDPLPDGVQNLPEQMGAWFLTGGDVVRPLMQDSPNDELGPRIFVSWRLLGPAGGEPDERTVRQEYFPNAVGGPLVHTPDGQGLWTGAVGWFRAAPDLVATLEALGVKANSHDSGRSAATIWLVLSLAVAGVFGTVISLRRWDLASQRRSADL